MIKFREANLDDIYIYFNWVNDPLVRFNSFNTNKVTLSDHEKWFKRKVKDENCLLLMFTVYDKPFGQVRFEKEKFNYWVINISISN
ncbi:hypothetical protein N9H42_07560, partial [Flavobacteriaceae bacterium]|nr:hypothetical protein [Flavobacteriaceae bacterium]